MTDKDAEELGKVLGGCLISILSVFFWMLLGGVLTYIMVRIGWIS